MKCAWEAYLAVLPIWMRQDVDKLGKDTLQEIRLRLDRPVEMKLFGKRICLDRSVSRDDLSFVINAASRYSPWSARTTTQGYITAPGGHRIGLCGEVVAGERGMQGIREPTSLCLRVARDFPGVGKHAAQVGGSLLIIGSPGSGKTTLLRDIIRQKSDVLEQTVTVVDEREEIFPRWQSSFCFPPGRCTDILSGCNKREAVAMLLRTMAPDWVALDEITTLEDCEFFLKNAWCGVKFLATAHAESLKDLQKREIYNRLLESGIFSYCVVLRRDQTFVLERMVI